MGFLDVFDTDGKDHMLVARPGGLRMQGIEDPYAGVGRDLEFHESLPFVKDREPQNIPVEGDGLLPLLADENRVEAPDGRRFHFSPESWSEAS